ncbi:MAG: hypothetical protein ACFFCS_01790 [Candidatus Hodarchaeota archaeon]
MILDCCDAQIIVDSVQTHLDDFTLNPRGFKTLARMNLYPGLQNEYQKEKRPKLYLDRHKVIALVKPRCPDCGKKLIKWGKNKRKLILDHGHVPHIKGVQRYRCPLHGEIKVDLGVFVEERKQYARNWRRRATQLMYDGATPPAVHRTLKKVYNMAPCVTSIRNWAYEAADAATKVVDAGLVPSSGYYGYDEIHLIFRDTKVYIQTAIDLVHSFVPRLGYSTKLTTKSTLLAWDAIHSNPRTRIDGLVIDGASGYIPNLRLPRYAHVKAQLCITHYKKGIAEKMHKMAGLGKKLKVPLHEPYASYKRILYGPFNRSSRVNAEFSLAQASIKLEDVGIYDLTQLLHDIIFKADFLFRYLEYPRLHRTNNKNERFNFKLEKYPTLKTKMHTGLGIKRVADAITFLHNYDLFPGYLKLVRKRCKLLRAQMKESEEDHDLVVEYMTGLSHIHQVLRWKGVYDKVYADFFEIKPYPPNMRTTEI